MKIAFVGASGYGNVGDDTYPLVFQEQFRGAELLFFNSDLPAEMPSDLDLVVLGGGGIIYNSATHDESPSPHFRCMQFYMDHAIASGTPWGFLSCGSSSAPAGTSTSAPTSPPGSPICSRQTSSPSAPRNASRRSRTLLDVRTASHSFPMPPTSTVPMLQPPRQVDAPC
ncbi:hypothetical protein [Verrucomicrobium spinosum]|uniref:hypothetical protein n=1 Tax=Verrucomicrobium spinosum TaxID=2736 RepID=UPI000946618C|nr:hypothetical protein [Verrucomicrobium spinosum]